MSYQIEYIKSILQEVKKKAVGILVITLICGIAIGGFGYAKAKRTANYVEANKKEIEEYEAKIVELEAAIKDTEDNLQLQQTQIDELQKYVNESIYMSLNGDEIPTADVQWTLTTETADKNAVLTTIRTYVLEGGLRDAVDDKDGQLKTRYWNEVVVANIGWDTLSISIMQPTSELAEQSIRLIAEKVNAYVPELRATYGNLSLNDEVISTYIKADAGIVNGQNSYYETLKNYNNAHADLSARLVSQKDALKTYKEENAPEVYEDISASATKNAIKYAIIGAMIGLVLGIGIVMIDYCMCGRLRIAEDVKKYGLTLIAKQKNGALQPEIERACMDISMYMQTYGTNEIALYHLDDDNRAKNLCSTFASNLGTLNITADVVANADISAAAMSTLIKCKTVCLVLAVGKTETKKIEETIAMCKQYGITIIGCIVA